MINLIPRNIDICNAHHGATVRTIAGKLYATSDSVMFHKGAQYDYTELFDLDQPTDKLYEWLGY